MSCDAKLTDRAASCSKLHRCRARNATRSCSRNGRSCQNSIASGATRKPDQIGRPWHGAERIMCGDYAPRLFRRRAGFPAVTIAGSPRRRSARAGRVREIGVGFRVATCVTVRECAPAGAAISSGSERSLRAVAQFATLGAVVIGIEDEASFIEALQQHHADIGQAVGVGGRERHRVRIVWLRARRFLKPGCEKPQRLVGSPNSPSATTRGVNRTCFGHRQGYSCGFSAKSRIRPVSL